jgi:hypothetical protein
MIKKLFLQSLNATAHVAVVGTIAVGMMAPAAAQEFPNRPLTLVVPFPPGGVADTVGRPIAEAMGRALNQPVVVENRSGAGGSIGFSYVAKAKPDGYTILFSSIGAHAISPHMLKKLPFNPSTAFTCAAFPRALCCGFHQTESRIGQQRGQRPDREPRIGLEHVSIDERDQIAGGRCHTLAQRSALAGAARPTGVGVLADDTGTSTLGLCDGVVTGSAVHDDDLIDQRHADPGDGTHRAPHRCDDRADPRALVASRDDDGRRGPGVRLHPCERHEVERGPVGDDAGHVHTVRGSGVGTCPVVRSP